MSALLVLNCVNTRGLPTHLDIDHSIHDATIKMPLLCYKCVNSFHSFHSLFVPGLESTTTLDTQWLLHVFMTSSRPDQLHLSWRHAAHGIMQYMLSVHDLMPFGNNCTYNSHKLYSNLLMQFVGISIAYFNYVTAAM